MACNLLPIQIWTLHAKIMSKASINFHKLTGSKIRFYSNPFSVMLFDNSWNHTSYNKKHFSGIASGLSTNYETLR